MCLFKIQKVLEINNLVNESLYQHNLDFSKFYTKYKILAIYYPQNYINKIVFDEDENTHEKEEINLSESLIKQQINLAKIHGIFGYGIVYNLNYYEKSIYIISIFFEKTNFEYLNLANSFVEFPSKNIYIEKNLSKEYIYNYYYPNLNLPKL